MDQDFGIIPETTTFMLYKRATSTKRFAKKLQKQELGLRFLIASRDGIYPKFSTFS